MLNKVSDNMWEETTFDNGIKTITKYKQLSVIEALKLLLEDDWLPEGYIEYNNELIPAQLRGVDKGAGLYDMLVTYDLPENHYFDENGDECSRLETSFTHLFFIKAE